MATLGTSIAAASGAVTDVGTTFAQSAEAACGISGRFPILSLVQKYLQMT